MEDTEIASRNGLTMSDPLTGFECKLLKKVVGDKIAYALTFAGTDMEQWIYIPALGTYNPDLFTDMTQVFGLYGQYQQSLEIAQQLSSILHNYELTFIGHSLGGGEAALAAMVTGRYAITYNPAGLSAASLSWLQSNGYSTDTSRIYRYVATGDEIDDIQGFFGIESQGHNIEVPNVNGYSFQHPIANIIENMKQ